MGVFDKGAYQEAYERLIKKSVVPCRVTSLRNVEGKDPEDGSPRRDVTFVQLSTLAESETTDGEKLEPGFVKEIGFGYYDDTGGDDKMTTTNRMTMERIRELVVHALGLPANCKNAHEELMKQGGPSALEGKVVSVQFSARNGRQNIDSFLAPPTT